MNENVKVVLTVIALVVSVIVLFGFVFALMSIPIAILGLIPLLFIKIFTSVEITYLNALITGLIIVMVVSILGK